MVEHESFGLTTRSPVKQETCQVVTIVDTDDPQTFTVHPPLEAIRKEIEAKKQQH